MSITLAIIPFVPEPDMITSFLRPVCRMALTITTAESWYRVVLLKKLELGGAPMHDITASASFRGLTIVASSFKSTW